MPMGFMRRFGSGPFMGSARNLPIPDPSLLRNVRYQINSSEHGLPMIQLELDFQQTSMAVVNPEMSLVVLIDRSGSMEETYREGHVYDVAAAIFNAIAATREGYDLVFYDNVASYAGHIGDLGQLRSAIDRNPPRGGTYITEALRGAIQRYQHRRGVYLIVITDGEFADKTAVQSYVVDTLLPQLTPENPYAFRLHFVGAGHGVDREFLEGLEAAASGKGIQLVKHHHHAHLRHSHADILTELDGAYLGIATNAVLGQNSPSGESVVTRVGNVAVRRWQDGNLQDIGFVPRRALLGLEFADPHPQSLEVALRYEVSDLPAQQLAFTIPLPRSALSDATSSVAPTARPRFHLPWRHSTPEDEAARTAAAQAQAELAQRIQQVRQAEAQRQARDLQLLGRGGIPSMAQERLTELRGADPEHATFTSDLSPDESALLRRNGYRPLGLVSGSAMYHVGQAYASSYSDCEVTVLSQAYNTATQLAVQRLQQEATLLGAHGVVGVRFEIVRHEWADKTIEVQLLGTAIAGPDRSSSLPWLSDLSGQEWWALYRAGYTPVGLVYGHCAWFVLTTQSDEWVERSFANQELAHMSQALSQARLRAMQQIKADARKMGATGVVGVHLSRRLDEIRLSGPGEDPAYEREHHNLMLSIIGTAVTLRPDAPRQVRATTPVLSLREGRLVPYKVTTIDARFD